MAASLKRATDADERMDISARTDGGHDETHQCKVNHMTQLRHDRPDRHGGERSGSRRGFLSATRSECSSSFRCRQGSRSSIAEAFA